MNEIEKTYNEQYNKVLLQIRALETALENHEKNTVTVGATWAAVGDLNHASEMISELHKFIDGNK